jgi:UDP-glucose 4-epimerase
VIPLTIRRILANEPPVLEGDGTQTRDFTFVRDTARLTVQLVECDGGWGRTLNVAASEEVSIGHLVETIANVMSYTGPILRRPPRPGDHRRHLADASSARALVTFDPLTPLEEGLAATVQYFRRRTQPLTTP